jgi:hypothetical protein
MYRANPARAREVVDAVASVIAAVVAGLQERGRLVTGSMRCPAILAHPIAEATAAGPGLPPLARYAANSAPAGMYHGAAMPVPQPASTPALTENGAWRPKGSPGMS